MTLDTMQSSAYVPVCVHVNLSNRSSRAILPSDLSSQAHRNAIRNLWPSFSSSAITQSVTHGIHLANKQSIIPRTGSILFCIEKLMKLVSIIIRYGGPRAWLYWKNKDDATCGLKLAVFLRRRKHFSDEFAIGFFFFL
jgi:hypothetical protein